MNGARESAEWIIAKIKAEADTQGQPLSADEEEVLRTDVRTLGQADRERMVALNNRVVELVRAAIERDKRGGAPVTKVRRGLRAPNDWVAHYGGMYAADLSLPWALGGILQNAMLQNPFAGERRPWRSR